ncbi:MAG: hypothetical protein OEY03_10690 [Rhizobacter sp.]|nr:hypothetical protein [Rhizobacter sp.]
MGTGLPRLIVGVAQPLSDTVLLRADAASIGSITDTYSENGIIYRGRLRHDRIGLFADWFVAGGFRLTSGLTVNDTRLNLNAQGNGGSLTIGSTTYVTTPDDRWSVDVRFPRATPYLGLGYGRQPGGTAAIGFAADLGVSIGRAKVSARVSGPNLPGAVTQEDIDRELAELRNDVARVRVIPQLSAAISFRF